MVAIWTAGAAGDQNPLYLRLAEPAFAAQKRAQFVASGGDPDNVTIAGESAGAFSVGTLLGLPRAAGLFRRAILQSGAAHHALPLEAAEKVADLFCEELGAPSADDLLAAPVQDILDAINNAAAAATAPTTSKNEIAIHRTRTVPPTSIMVAHVMRLVVAQTTMIAR